MLNPFPELLSYSFLAPTILRVGLALVLFMLVAGQLNRRSTIFSAAGMSPIVYYFVVILELLAGAALFVGIQTQIAAITTALLALFLLRIENKNPLFVGAGRTALLLMIVISLSLLITGAGALAYDIPL